MKRPKVSSHTERVFGAGSTVGWRALRISIPVLVGVTMLALAVASPVAARTPRLKKPGAPTALTAVPIHQGAELSWMAPTSDGGSPITGYIASVGTQTCQSAGATQCSVAGLQDGHKYYARVRAINAVGPGKTSTRVLVIPSINCTIFQPDSYLQGCDFANADLSGANLTGSNLSNANLTGANLSDATLTDANLTGTQLSGANLVLVTSGGIIGTPSSIPTHYLLFNGYLIGSGAILTNANLTNLNMPSAGLVDANFTGADLTDANLEGTSLYNSNLNNTNLTGANLSNASLDIVSMTASNLTGTNLSGASFIEIASSGGIVRDAFGNSI